MDSLSGVEIATKSIDSLKIGDQISSKNSENGLQINCFSELIDGVVHHFQIIRLRKQIYAWVGCNSAKFGHLYAAGPARPTGLDVVLACSIPKNSPMLEANAEKVLVQKLIKLSYTRSKSGGSSS